MRKFGAIFVSATRFVGTSCLLGITLGTGVGCGPREPLVFPTWAKKVPEYAPVADSTNAFDTYCEVADSVSRNPDVAELLTRTTFYPQQKADIISVLETELPKLKVAVSKTCNFQFVPFGLHDPSARIRGWRLISRGLQWKIETQVKAKKTPDAVRLYLVALKLGFDLTQGGALEASIGLQLIDGSRQALVPVLKELSPSELDTIYRGTQNALNKHAKLEQLVSHEIDNSLLALQQLQDSFLAHQLEASRQDLGNDFNEDFEQLGRFSSESNESVKFFSGIAKSIEQNKKRLLKNVQLPRSARIKPVEKPKKKFNLVLQTMLDSIDPMIDAHDITLARVKIFALTAAILNHQKLGAPSPKNLQKFSKLLTSDPFTGAPLGYKVEEKKFLIYSTGIDCKDDAGKTDGAFSSPDLTLEVAP